jgi:hypothetical protein
LPFHSGSAGVERRGGTIDKRNRPKIVRRNGSIFIVRRDRALRERKFGRWHSSLLPARQQST